MPRRPRFLTVTVDEYRRLPSEAEMLAGLTDAVTAKGGRLWHVNDSRSCPELVDLPDVIALVPGLALLLELKSQRRRFASVNQEAVCRLLETVEEGITGVVRPVPKPGEYSYDEVLDLLGER